MASVLELVKHYQRAIERYPNDEEKILKCIDKLFNLDVTVQHLQETGVGRTVNALRKESGDVGQASRALVYKWKAMVAAEGSDQEDHKNDTTSYNGHEYEKDYGGNTENHRNRYDQHEQISRSSKTKEDHKHKNLNGDHSGSKRKYHSSEEEPDIKKSRHLSSSDDEYGRKSDVQINHKSLESESEQQDTEESQSDDSDSEESQKSEDNKIVNHKIKVEKIEEEKKAKPSSHDSHKRHKNESVSQKSHDSYNKHSKIKSESKNPEKSSSIEKDSHKYSSSNEKERSLDKQHKSNHKSSHKEKQNEELSRKHSSSKSHKSSSSDKNRSQSDKHSNKSESHSNSSHTKKIDKEKHKSSSEKQVSNDKQKSKDQKSNSSSSSKEKHKSTSKEKLKERNSSAKDIDHKSKEKHSSSKDRSKDNSKRSHSSDKKDKESKSTEQSSDKKKKHSSSSSSKVSKSSIKLHEDIPKKKQCISQSEDSDDGIGCESGASFAEALGMISPTKPKKKQVTKDTHSPNSSVDLSPATLLAPTAKLAPLPPLEISALPEISPNYKPRPPPKLLPHFTDEDAMNHVISSKNQRTKVYSGNKVFGKIPSLYEMCVHLLQEHIDALEYTGGVPYEILKPVVDRANPNQLFMLEHFNPYLMEDTDHLWQMFCQKHFRNKQRQEMETWREMFIRCQEEQEHRLKSLTANIKIAQEAKKAPIKQTKMAYVDSVVKPPRNIARKQALHGTAYASTASPAARVASLATAPNVLRGGSVRPPSAASVSTSSLNKPKKAPLMQKALQFMRGRKR